MQTLSAGQILLGTGVGTLITETSYNAARNTSVTGISITGGIAISGAISIQGSGSIGMIQNGNTIIVYPIRGLFIGSGSPEGVVIADSGSLYTDWFNTLLYQKVTGNAAYGWV